MLILEEYVSNINNNGWKLSDFENELKRLIGLYNKIRNTNLIVYVSSFEPKVPSILERRDFFYFKDLLDFFDNKNNLDIYLETPGGDGVVAEEIVRYVRNEYKNVSFVICGEAKSAGTIMAMGGDEILMTKTGSLGPIDAQLPSNRGVVSAFDYVEWIKEKKEEAEKNGKLNPADAIIIAQISPGEINGAENSLEYAKELVEEWLCKYKFKNWSETETRKIKVTDEMKLDRASYIANQLSDHGKWKTHGRPLKIKDLENIGLKIASIDENVQLSDIVYRINLVCRMMFNMSNNYKMFYTEKMGISLSAQPKISHAPFTQPIIPACIDIKHSCSKCEKKYVFYAKLIPNSSIDKENIEQGKILFPANGKYKCQCGNVIDLSPYRIEIENRFNRKICS